MSRMSSNLSTVTSILYAASFLLSLVLVRVGDVDTASIVESGDLTANRFDLFENWLDLLRSALLERDNDVSKSESSFEKLKHSIADLMMRMCAEDEESMDVLRELVLQTRTRFLLHNDGNRLKSEDIYRDGEKLITAMQQHLPTKLNRGTMGKFSHSAKDHIDGQELHVYLARLLKQLNWKGMHIEQSLSDGGQIVDAQLSSLRQQSDQRRKQTTEITRDQ